MKQLLYILFLWLGLSLPFALSAQDIPDPMSPPRLVNDFAGAFQTGEREDLEQMLRNYNDTTSTQIYVVTVNDLGGYAISDYAFKLGEKWGIGQKGKNNGAVILIKPKRGNSRGDVFIAVGYGLEEKLNDARIGRIIDTYMIPYFRQDDYYNGAKAAANAMIKYLAGQFQADEEDDTTGAGDVLISILLVLLFIYFMSKIGGNNKGGGNRSSGGGMFFPPISGGGFGGGRSGGFGGGFGGGGGGSFGGGGAGRSW